MKLQTKVTETIIISCLKRLDPITCFITDFEEGKGRIVIECFGKAWAASWNAMGNNNLRDFFCSCDVYYLAKNLSNFNTEIYDIDAIKEDAQIKGIDVTRDDPWNDLQFMRDMYGNDPADWYDSINKKVNPDYEYLCKIIKVVQIALKNIEDELL